MPSRSGLLAAAAIGAALLCGSTAVAGPAGLTLDDAQKLVTVGAPHVSPDGKWIAYTLTRTDTEDDKTVSNLWMVSWDGKDDIQLTFGKTSVGNPQWSPDGRWIAFTTDREGEAKGTQVWALDRRGGEARQITDVKDELEDYRWSPDSRSLLLQITGRDEPLQDKGAKAKPPKPIALTRFHFKEDIDGYLTELKPHLFVYDLETRKLAKLTSGPDKGPDAYDEQSAEWSPDGSQVAFVSNQSKPDPDRVDNGDIFVVAAKPGSAPRRLTSFPGPDNGPLVWTPDSQRLVFHEDLLPHYSIYNERRLASAAAAGGPTVILAPKLDQWFGPPVISPSGASVLTVVADDRQDYLAEVALDPAVAPHRLTTGSGAVQGLAQAGGHVALLWTTDDAPAELFALDGGALRRLTHHNDALIKTLKLAATEDISAKASDGSEVHGLLTLPADYAAGTRVPMILRIHGGPTAQDAHGFNLDRQLFAAKGYAVLNVNYRGSTGRGHAYSEAINADWGHKEVLDLLAAVDAAVATHKIDPQQLGVAGWSYGGILTDYTIASTNRFKAASSGAGVANVLAFYGVDEYILQYETEIGAPWKNLNGYLKLSYPFLHADRIKTPTLFMGGDKDFNVPLQGGEQMYQALKSVGTPTELIVYPGEFHGFRRPSFIRDRYERWFGWFDHYVRGVTPTDKPATPKG